MTPASAWPLRPTALAYKPLKVASTDAQKDFCRSGRSRRICRLCPDESRAPVPTRPLSRSLPCGTAMRWLNGRKVLSHQRGGVASVHVIFSTDTRPRASRGLTAFLVERDRPGLSVGKEEDKMGIRLSNTCDVVLEDVRVPGRPCHRQRAMASRSL